MYIYKKWIGVKRHPKSEALLLEVFSLTLVLASNPGRLV